MIERPADRRDYGDRLVRAIGEADGLVLHVVFTDRGDVRRIISARIANRKERTRWLASR
nr:BrnT family toxin [uncultured Rhodopila sp.]